MKYLVAFLFIFNGIQLNGQASNLNYSLVRSSPDLPGYFVHLPDAYDNNTTMKYPLIVFLHGQGERDFGGQDDLARLLKWGPPRIVSENGPAYKAIHPYRFIILAPQLKGSESSWRPDQVDAFLTIALKKYRIDESRIYLTGISLGGNGVWNYAYSDFNSPNKLAAIAPISAWGNPENACKIVDRNIPVWGFHGVNDKVIPFSQGNDMYSAMGDCGISLDLKKFRFSPVNAAHTAWPEIYSSVSDSLSIYDWFMSFSLTPGTKSAAIPDTTDWSPPPSISLEPELIGQVPESLNEISGLKYDPKGRIWAHNDSGNKADLFEIDSAGNILRQVHLGYSRNTDWEDIASDKEGNLYVGDIGNNLNARNKLFIYKVSETELEKENPQAEVISFVYSDQTEFPPATSEMHYDAESLLHYDGSLYIFTKNRTEPFTGYTHIYRIPDTPGDYTAQLVDSLKLGEGIMTNFWLTSADISPDEERIALLSHDKVWILSCFKGKRFSEGNLLEVKLNSYSQKEGVTFTSKNTLLISDERIRNILGGNMYRLELPDASNKSCD